MSKPFWESKSLADMTRQEWESLCDGCARCCLIKLEDEDDGSIHYTNVVCDLLDLEVCRCTEYETRSKLVPESIQNQCTWPASLCVGVCINSMKLMRRIYRSTSWTGRSSA
jgi:uncharacterized cysteine cluster protein YcgN (CxxCxxCC family)